MTGEQLQRIRRRLKLTQVQLAKRIGVTSNTVARWEQGRVAITEPTARLITMVARAEFRPDSEGESADWPKRTRDVDATGKPVARRTSKRRKQGGK